MSLNDDPNAMDSNRRALKRHALYHFSNRWHSSGSRLQARAWLIRAVNARLALAKAEWQAEQDERRYDMPSWAHPAT
jgi:hypothetical protein